MFVQILCLTGIIRAVVLIVPFKWISIFLGQQGMETPFEEDAALMEVSRKSKKIGRAIETVSRHTPWESKCMVQAITGKILMEREGIPNTLYFGVRKNEKNEMIAHAWLRVGPAVITGRQGMKEFKVVSCFGSYKERNNWYKL